MQELRGLCNKYYSELEYLGYINGCGASKGFKFDAFIFGFLEAQPYYDKEKGKKLYDEIKIEGCGAHDLCYCLGMNKLYSDLQLALFIYKKLHWTSLYIRLSIFFGVLGGLVIYGGGAYKQVQKTSYTTIYENIQNLQSEQKSI